MKRRINNWTLLVLILASLFATIEETTFAADPNTPRPPLNDLLAPANPEAAAIAEQRICSWVARQAGRNAPYPTYGFWRSAPDVHFLGVKNPPGTALFDSAWLVECRVGWSSGVNMAATRGLVMSRQPASVHTFPCPRSCFTNSEYGTTMFGVECNTLLEANYALRWKGKGFGNYLALEPPPTWAPQQAEGLFFQCGDNYVLTEKGYDLLFKADPKKICKSWFPRTVVPSEGVSAWTRIRATCGSAAKTCGGYALGTAAVASVVVPCMREDMGRAYTAPYFNHLADICQQPHFVYSPHLYPSYVMGQYAHETENTLKRDCYHYTLPGQPQEVVERGERLQDSLNFAYDSGMYNPPCSCNPISKALSGGCDQKCDERAKYHVRYWYRNGHWKTDEAAEIHGDPKLGKPRLDLKWRD